MHLADNFEVVDHPVDESIAIPDNAGSFSTKFQLNPGIFIFSEQVKMDKTVYSPEEYPYLKEMYNKIIQAHKANILFKKKL